MRFSYSGNTTAIKNAALFKKDNNGIHLFNLWNGRYVLTFFFLLTTTTLLFSAQPSPSNEVKLLSRVDSLISFHKEFDEARVILLNIIDTPDITENILKAYLLLVSIEIGVHDFDLALDYIRKVDKLIEPPLYAEVHFKMKINKACIYTYTGHYDKASAIYYNLIEEIKEEEGNFQKLSNLYNNLGNTLFCLKLDTAEEKYEKSIFYAKKAGEISFSAYNNIIDFYMENLNYKAAGKYIDSLLYFSSEESRPINLISGKMKRARLFAEIGQAEKAMRLMKEYKELAKKQKCKFFVQDKIYDSYIFYANNQLDSAIYYARQVVEHAIEKNEMRLADIGMTHLAKLYSKSGNPKAAVDIYEKYIYMYKNLGRSSQVATLGKRMPVKVPIFPKYFWGIGLAMFLLSGFLLRSYLHKKRQLEDLLQKTPEAEAAEEDLQPQLEAKNQLLTNVYLANQQNIAFVTEIKTDIRRLGHDKAKLQKNINSLIVKINNNIDFQSRWDQVHFYFCETFPTFICKLKEQHPNLTNTELRLCMFLKLNLTTEEISRILNIEISSVNSAKYRLKKKINLDSLVEIS